MAAFRMRDATRAMAIWRLHLQRSGAVVCEVLRRQMARDAAGPRHVPAG